MLEIRTQKSEIVRNLLRHNYTGWPQKLAQFIKRLWTHLKYILFFSFVCRNRYIEKQLRSAIKREDDYEADMIQQMKENSPLIVLIR